MAIIKGGLTLLQKLQELYGARAVTDRLGKMTNVQTTAQGANNPFSGIFSKKYLGKNQDSIDEAHNVIMDNMQFAFGNKNSQQMKNFETNVNMLYDMKFPPAKAEAEILDLSTKKQVTGTGIESLKKELGLPEGIDPNSPMGKLITTQNKMNKAVSNVDHNIGKMFVDVTKAAAGPINRQKEALVRTAAREFLNREVKLKKLNLNEKELKSIVSPSGSGEDPINVLRKYYGENTLEEFDNIGDKFLNTEKYSDFNKIIDKNIDSSFLKPRKNPNIKESYTDEEFAELINRNVNQVLSPKTKEKDLVTKLKKVDKEKPTVRESLDDEAVEITEQKILDDLDDDIPFAQGGIAGQLHMNEGGRVGMLVGGSVLKTIIKNLAKERGVKPSYLLELINVKSLPKQIRDNMSPKQIKSFLEKRIEQVENYKGMMESKLKFNQSIQQGKALDDKGTGMSDIFDFMDESFSKGSPVPRNVDKADVLQMEQMIKNMRMKDRKLNAEGGRIGFKNGGMDRRSFMKLIGGLASIPVLGKFFKGAKVASKIAPLQNTTTVMPAWFPDLVDKFIAKGVGKKIDADMMEYTTKDLPGIKMTKHDDGRIFVEGQNDYSRGYDIEYQPPGYEVVDYKTGKAVKTKGDFTASEEVPVNADPDGNLDFEGEILEEVGDILTSDGRVMEEFATGTKLKTSTRGEHRVGQAEVAAENAADDAAERAAMEADDYAKGGLAGQLKL